jgi:photosystem II stability/assembly factor-like uncharacterized protein
MQFKSFFSAGTIASLAFPGLVLAQTRVDSTLFRGMEWRTIGPNRGGRSITAVGSASRPLEYYFGATGGGLWKTTDGGVTWRPVTDGLIHSSSVGAVAVAESNPDVVYIGMGETEFRGNILQGDGVYRSTDAGKTWTHLGLDQTEAIAKIRVDPHNADVVYVAAFGHPYGRNTERGVFKSTDGGKSWRKILYRDDKTAAIDISIDPSNPNILYAALWEAYRTPWSMSSGGPGSGLFKSTDAGETWTEITRNPGLPKGVVGKIGVSVSPVDPNRVFAIIENENGGVFRSEDAGATWSLVNNERKLRQRAFYYTHIVADTKLKNRVYVLNVSFFRSDDGGARFDSTIAVPHGDNHDLWIAPNDNQRMIEANDGGGTISFSAGRSWSEENFPTAQLYHVAVTTDFPYHVCGAQQDNSTLCLPSNGWSNLRGARTRQLGDWMYDVGGGESGYIAPDPKNPNIIYAGSQGALLTRFDRSNGQIRDVQVYPRFFSGEPSSALPERWQWTYPIVFSPKDPTILYTSSQHLWRTIDQGQTWQRISPDLTRADPSTLGESGGPITHDMNGPEVYGTIFTIAPSPLDVTLIWTGSDDGLAYVTRDGGKSWTNVTPVGLPKFARISLIDASPNDPGSAYLAAKNYQNDDRAPYIYRTHDFGKTWTKVVTGIRGDDYVHAVREDPKRRGLLYAGTEHGIYVSWNDGDSWQSLSMNLADVQVSDLLVLENDVVIATHGRSMYVLDDIAPIRELGPTFAGAPLKVMKPRVATRDVDEAVIQYALARQADSVRIEILDASGKVVRKFDGGGAERADSASGRSEVPRDSAQRALAGATPADTIVNPTGCENSRGGRRGGAGATRPSGRAGLNRFVWDLRYPGPTTFPCLVLWGASADQGPLAVPGQYRVRVSAAGQTQTQTLVVRMDPRLKGVTLADLREQFALATQIRDKLSAANEAVLRIRRLKSAIANRLAHAESPEIVATANDVTHKLSTVEDSLYQVRNRSGQDPLNFPIKLNNRIGALGRSVTTGDARPTAASYTVFRELSAQLDVELKQLEHVISTDVEALNRALAGRNIDRIRAE